MTLLYECLKKNLIQEMLLKRITKSNIVITSAYTIYRNVLLFWTG